MMVLKTEVLKTPKETDMYVFLLLLFIIFVFIISIL